MPKGTNKVRFHILSWHVRRANRGAAIIHLKNIKMLDKIIFETHITPAGRIVERKAKWDCTECGGEAYLIDEESYPLPNGGEVLTFMCTDCAHKDIQHPQ